MQAEYQLYIDGQWTPQTDGCVRPDLEPATGNSLCQVHRAGPMDVERALTSAQAAFAGWSLTMADQRERILLRAADILDQREDEFMDILVRESGTEPLVRVMVEAETPELCQEYVYHVVNVIKAKGHEVK